MSRYVKTLNTGRSAEEAQHIASEYLTSEGFVYRDERGEMLWRKGVGALTSPQFIKADITSDGTAHIEAWIAGIAFLPGVYLGELDPTQGGYGFAIKAMLKPRVAELERRLGSAGGGASAVPPGWQPDPTGRHEQRYWDGAQWTANVSDAGQTTVDPQGAA